MQTCTAEPSRLPLLRTPPRARRRLRTEQSPSLRSPLSPSLRCERPCTGNTGPLLLAVGILPLPDRSAHEGAAVVKSYAKTPSATGKAKKVRGTAPVNLLLVPRAMEVDQRPMFHQPYQGTRSSAPLCCFVGVSARIFAPTYISLLAVTEQRKKKNAFRVRRAHTLSWGRRLLCSRLYSLLTVSLHIHDKTEMLCTSKYGV